MAYDHPDKEVKERTDALVSAVNSALQIHYQKTKTEVNQRISISVSMGPGGKVRTPEEQASYLLKGTSWTANSSHMSDGAKHILVRQGAQVVWKLKELETKQKDAWAVLAKEWNAAMKTHDLRNYRGEKSFDYPGSDPLHMELPESRLPDNDPRVMKTLDIYAKATRLEGKSKNLAFENTKGSYAQKNWLHAYDQKLAKAGQLAKGGKGP